MMETIQNFNMVIFWLMTLAYFYQFIYAAVGFFVRKKNEMPEAKQLHKYAAIIAARNESGVIDQLIRNLKEQKYPSDLIDVFVVADNCTDDTAEVSRRAGAIVYERQNKLQVGKGFALDFLFKRILTDHADAGYEAFLIFDADNLVDENFVFEMNKVYDQGYRVATSYRNSKNYGTNWITAGYSLWFLREARYLNSPRMHLRTNCAVSGTGFMVASEIIKNKKGWDYHLLTEDIEFSVDCAIQGELVGYCENAKLYDEQPTTFKQSWTQRLRWSKGFYQVTRHYGPSLVSGSFKGRTSLPCYDMLMTIAPATLVMLFCVAVNVGFLLTAIGEPIFFAQRILRLAGTSLLFTVVNFYLLLFAMGALTLLTEWKAINATPSEKIRYLFSFPIFIFTYVPICIVALIQKVEWKPIDHSVVKSLDQVR